MFYKHTQDTETSQQFSTVDKQTKCTCSSYFSQTKAWMTKRSLSPWLISCFTVKSVLNRQGHKARQREEKSRSQQFLQLFINNNRPRVWSLLVSQSQPPTTSSYSRTLNTVFLPVLFGIGAQCDVHIHTGWWWRHDLQHCHPDCGPSNSSAQINQYLVTGSLKLAGKQYFCNYTSWTSGVIGTAAGQTSANWSGLLGCVSSPTNKAAYGFKKRILCIFSIETQHTRIPACLSTLSDHLISTAWNSTTVSHINMNLFA